jgi:WD40 repeat protein
MTCLAFSPDGSILASGTMRGTSATHNLGSIHLWDVARGKELGHFRAHPDLVRSMSFSPGGKTLASIGLERMIRLWDVATMAEAFPRSGHQSPIWTVAVSPVDGTVFTSGTDRTIRQWDLTSRRELGIVAIARGSSIRRSTSGSWPRVRSS